MNLHISEHKYLYLSSQICRQQSSPLEISLFKLRRGAESWTLMKSRAGTSAFPLGSALDYENGRSATTLAIMNSSSEAWYFAFSGSNCLRQAYVQTQLRLAASTSM